MKLYRYNIAALIAVVVWCAKSEAFASSDPGEDVNLSTKISYWFDHTGNLSLEEIRTGDIQAKFKAQSQKNDSFGRTEGRLWIKVQVDFADTKKYMLGAGFPVHNLITFYSPLKEGGWKISKGGNEFPIYDQEIPFKYPVFPIQADDVGEVTFYLSVESDYPISLPLHFYTESGFQKFQVLDHSFFGIYAGIILAMVLYNLFLFIAVRDPGYIYYSCTILLIFGGLFLYLEGIVAQYLFPDNFYLRQRSGLVFGAAGALFGQLNASVIIGTKRYAPWIHKILIYTISFHFVFILWTLIEFRPIQRDVVNVASFASMILMFVAAVRVSLKKYVPAMIFLAAWTAVFAGSVLKILSLAGAIPQTFLAEKGVLFGAIVETILLSFGLAYRIKLLHKESDDAKARMDRLKDEFLANTSHELRTPLNGIIGITESLRDGYRGALSNAVRDDLTLITSAGKRLLTLVNDILDFSKLKQKKFTIDKRPVSVGLVCNMVTIMTKSLADQKGLEVKQSIPENLSAVLGDENRLEQIMFNLIGNAIKYSDRGTVKISAGEDVKTVWVTVADNGIGIAKEDHDRVFASFEQVDGSTSRREGGTGLGLAVSKKLVEMMGGSIHLKSELGKGSEFTVRLPKTSAKPEEDKSITTALTKISSMGSEDKGYEIENTQVGKDKPLIMAVDDDPLNLQVLDRHLKSSGFRIRLLNSGQEALKIIEAEGPPDLLLLDIMMPLMTGYELCTLLRKKFSGVELPILLLTAKNQLDDLITGLDVGANDYLVKPFTKMELIARVDSFLKLKEVNEQVIETKLEKAKMENDLEAAGAVQETLLPEALNIKDIGVSTYYKPADQTGGDWFHYYHDIKNQRLYLFIGDVAGHGFGSALVTGVVCGAVNALIMEQANQQAASPSVVMQNLLRRCSEVVRNTGGRVNKTMVLMALCLDLNTGEVEFSNAGHVPFLHVSSKKVYKKIVPGSVLGGSDAPNFNSKSFCLNKGESLVLFSDGLIENRGPDGKVVAERTISNLCLENHEDPDKILSSLVAAGTETWRDFPADDDVTLVVVKWQGLEASDAAA